MKRTLAALALAFIAAPAVAQPGVTEIEHEGRGLMNRWIAAYNKGDVDAMAALYIAPDRAALEKIFADLRTDSFGKLEAYSDTYCGKDSSHGQGILRFARIYTFGGKMNEDEARLFELEKTETGWLIAGEKEAAYNATLSCS